VATVILDTDAGEPVIVVLVVVEGVGQFGEGRCGRLHDHCHGPHRVQYLQRQGRAASLISSRGLGPKWAGG
jgi:hypothetical protein